MLSCIPLSITDKKALKLYENVQQIIKYVYVKSKNVCLHNILSVCLCITDKEETKMAMLFQNTTKLTESEMSNMDIITANNPGTERKTN